MTNESNKRVVTFSDTVDLTDDGVFVTSLEDSSNSEFNSLSFAEYCKRNPSASECKEYDI